MIDNRDKILQFIRMRGPVLPVQISKEINTNILMASAHLAELTSSQKLKVSAIKVGSSPLYYIPGQENMLQKHAGNLNEKEKKAFDLLSQSKILRDIEQEPVIRVALREIRDFAIPLNVNYNNTTEIFWKWFLASEAEAESLIRSRLQPQTFLDRKNDKKVIDLPIEDVKEKKEENIIEPVAEKKVRQKTLAKKNEPSDNFLNDLKKFFDKSKIELLDIRILKKNSEIDLILEIPTAMGKLQYFCRAKNKKRINESDLSAAYVKGHFRKLPVIFISKGELSAKAREMMNKELANMTFKKLE